MTTATEPWPSLPFDSWETSYATLHLWTQLVGKIRHAQTPWINHSWHVPLYLTARGLTTSPMPYGPRTFEIRFDLIEHRLVIEVSDGGVETLPLGSQSVAGFHDDLFGALKALGLEPVIHSRPNEVDPAVPFAQDHSRSAYNADYANRLWRVLTQAARVFQQFRARFTGKVSPVHFFWGSFDLAVTRFSGRLAPPHPGGIPNLPDWVTREAYSHELSSAGFYPGGGPHPFPFFYSYTYPEPEGFRSAHLHSESAFYSSELGEFILPYEAVREASSPDTVLLAFLQETYEAAARLGQWERSKLDGFEDPRSA